MARFLIMFLIVYSSMNALVFFNSRVLLLGSRPAQLILAIFFMAMILAPGCVRFLERNGQEAVARVLAWVGYPWMGFVFFAFCLFLLVMVCELLLNIVNKLLGIQLPLMSAGARAVIVLGVAVAICVYGFFEAHRIRVERVFISTEKLPQGVDSLKIAQISDVHLGLLVRDERLKAILDKIRPENPDLLVSTGDLVDGDIARFNGLAELFKQIEPKFGKYAVTGNHEFYAGLSQSVDALKSYGFVVLRGEAIEVGNILNIVGVDDAVRRVATDEISLLSSVRNGLFTLYLKHRPDVSPDVAATFDLQLSGHTHRGQIFPFSLVTRMVYPMQNGLYELGNGSKLYVSRGSGTWGPPMRVLSPPEVTIFEIHRKDGRRS